MYASKNFCNVDAFITNVPGENASAGELTPYAATFTREMGVYHNPNQPGYTLCNFKSLADGAPVVMDFQLVNQALAMVKLLVDKTLAVSGELFADELLTELTEWAAANDANSVAIGPVHEHNGRWVPDWIRWSSKLVVGDNENTVWLAIDAFVAQYSDYDIVVVPPVDNLDQFFATGSFVENMIKAITVPQTMEKIQLARDGHPDTILRSDNYDYINPLNPAQRVTVTWPVLIYGPAGNNVDAIKDALITYILAHSTHTRAEWTQIFPDIFRRTEFILAPHWQHYALPNMTLQHGVYSAIANLKEAVAFLKQVANEYPPAQIDDHGALMAHPYRSLQIGVVGGIENRDMLFGLVQVFPDYISVGTGSTDFNRMSPQTQAWAQMIASMLPVAEEMNESTTMPAGMMKMTRGGILYAVKTYQNIQYLIASKRSIYQMLGIAI